MAKEKIIAGIDVGSSKISTIIASVSENKISVIGVSGVVKAKGVRKGIIVNIDDAVESISKSLERAERMAGVSVSSAFVTVSGSHINTQNSHGVVAVSQQGLEIAAEDVIRVTDAAQAISLPSSREIVHVIPRDFVVDGQDGIKDPIGMSGIRLEVETNIIHGSTTSIKNLVKCIQQVGVEVRDLVYTGIASSESILTDTEKELGTVLIDIGGGTTSLCAFIEGSPIYSAVLPIGGGLITSDLAIGLRANMEAAEQIKLKLSSERVDFMSKDFNSLRKEEFDISEFNLENSSVPRELLYQIIDARLKEIFNLVALELHKAKLFGKLPAGVVLTGGASQTSGMERMAKSVLKAPVRVGSPKGVTGLIDEIQSPAFAATVGQILYGSSMVKHDSLLSFDSNKGKIGDIVGKLFEKLKSFLP